jgi:hypothetical protein
MKPMDAVLRFVVLTTSAFLAAPSAAESLVEQVVDTRLVLAFKVDPTELQKLIPGPWEIAGVPAGPTKDANLNVIFYERMLQHDGAGAPMGPPYRFVVFASTVRPKGATAAASVVSRIYASDQKRVPGPYQNSLHATVEHRHVIDSATSDPGTVEETWAIRGQPSHTMSLNVKYKKGTPARQKGEGNVYSSVNTSFYRTYRWDLLADVAKSGPAGVDRVTSYSFDAAIPEYANLFRSGQLVAVVSQPMYVRGVWLP